VGISNCPFCPVDPNIGVVEVPDDRLTKLVEILKSQTSDEFIRTFIY